MTFLKCLEIYRVRNIVEESLHELHRFNVFCGANGSGKTSVLESVYLLGMGRSFRSASVRPVIHHGDSDCILSGVVTAADDHQIRLGIQRDLQGGVVARADGATLDSVAQLAQRLPLQLINPESFELVSGGPGARRRFIDWGVFHVEHSYLWHWQRLQKALRQRNSMLRRGRMNARELAPWTRELIAAAEAVDGARQRYLAAYLPVFEESLGELLPDHGVTISYYPGWDRTIAYEVVLEKWANRDQAEGFTHQGPQRADLQLRISQRNAAEVLSRGQQKVLVVAMKLAQGTLLARDTGRQCVYLVDDLPAELDERKRAAILSVLNRMEVQVILTCVERGGVEPILANCTDTDDITMFHVEHGRIVGSGRPHSPG